jgi:coiled-coil domain-containing protein 130
MGRYYPPSSDEPPTFNTSSSLRATTRRNAATGAQTVRFEMPFAVWCAGCEARTHQPTLIPQGVRFNAEKKKVGMYLSTPVWSFRMRHGACGAAVEIRTDPKAGEYVVFEGGRRRDYGDADEGLVGGGGELLTEEERERRRNDAFAALEGKVVDKEKGDEQKDRIAGLRRWRERDWADPYEASRRVRKGFRAERKVREQKATETEALKDKFGLDLDLLEESAGDSARAELVDFGPVHGDRDATRKPLFADSDGQSASKVNASTKGMTQAQREAASSKAKLASELRGNTRAAMDPFLSEKGRPSGKKPLFGIKRKRTEDAHAPETPDVDGNLREGPVDPRQPQPAVVTTMGLGLTGYDSD